MCNWAVCTPATAAMRIASGAFHPPTLLKTTTSENVIEAYRIAYVWVSPLWIWCYLSIATQVEFGGILASIAVFLRAFYLVYCSLQVTKGHSLQHTNLMEQNEKNRAASTAAAHNKCQIRDWCPNGRAKKPSKRVGITVAIPVWTLCFVTTNSAHVLLQTPFFFLSINIFPQLFSITFTLLLACCICYSIS